MAFSNLDFETPGARAGAAQGWVVRERTGSRQLASFCETTGFAGVPPFDFAGSWTLTRVTGTPTAGAAPFASTPNADKLVPTVTSGTHVVTANLTAALGQVYTFSAFLKASGWRYVALQLTLGADTVQAMLDLTAGELLAAPSPVGAIAVVDAALTDVGGGWYLASLAFVAPAAGGFTAKLAFSSDGTTLSFAGDGVSGVFAWGAEVTEGQSSDAESFELGWLGNEGYLTEMIPAGIEATFDDDTVSPKPYESFESQWLNTPYLLAIASSEAASFDAGTPQAFEDFEEEWNNAPFLTVVTGTTASFDAGTPQAFEDFEEEWGNSPYLTTVTGTAATFNSGADAFESFGPVFPDVDVDADSSTDTFTAPAHGLANGTRVYVNVKGAGSGLSIPAGLVRTILYYIVGATTNTLQLSLTNGGAAVNFTDNGSGYLFLRGDPATTWPGDFINPTL